MTSLPSRLRFSFLTLLALLQIALAQSPPAPKKTTSPPKASKPSSTATTSTTGSAASAKTREKSPRCRPTNAPRATPRMKKGIHEHWNVKDGVLISDGKDPFLSTTATTAISKCGSIGKSARTATAASTSAACPKCKSGIRPIPTKQKLGCDKGSGALWNNKNHERFPLVVADKPVGEWNRMYIRMVGPYVTVKLNDKKTVDNVPLENYYDPKTPDLRHAARSTCKRTRPKLFFRNIFVREIQPKEANKILAKIGGNDADFKPIFNGKDLAGWTGATEAYEVKDDTLVAKAGQHGNMFTDDTYDNFVVRFEFKLPPGGNNGLGLRSPITDKEVAYEGMESQILDDGDAKYKDWLHPYQSHGSLYGLAPASAATSAPSANGTTKKLTIDGDKLTVELNGYEILNTNIAEVREETDGRQRTPRRLPHRRPLRPPRPPRPRRLPQHPHQTPVHQLNCSTLTSGSPRLRRG